MTGVRLSDLPAAVRARVEAQLGEPRHPRKSRAGVASSAPCPGHCGCGLAFPNADDWEHHADQDHGGNARWNIDLKALT